MQATSQTKEDESSASPESKGPFRMAGTTNFIPVNTIMAAMTLTHHGSWVSKAKILLLGLGTSTSKRFDPVHQENRISLDDYWLYIFFGKTFVIKIGKPPALPGDSQGLTFSGV